MALSAIDYVHSENPINPRLFDGESHLENAQSFLTQFGNGLIPGLAILGRSQTQKIDSNLIPKTFLNR